MQEYSVYFNSSFSIFSLASGACLFIFSGKPNMDTQAIRQIYDTFIVHTLTEDVKVKRSSQVDIRIGNFFGIRSATLDGISQDSARFRLFQ